MKKFFLLFSLSLLLGAAPARAQTATLTLTPGSQEATFRIEKHNFSITFSQTGKIVNYTLVSRGSLTYDIHNRLQRVGPVEISYNAWGKLEKIDNEAISFDLHDRLVQVGSTRITYNIHDVVSGIEG